MSVQREVSSEPLCPGNVKKWATVTHTSHGNTAGQGGGSTYLEQSHHSENLSFPTQWSPVRRKTCPPATQKQHCPESVVSPGSLQVEIPGLLVALAFPVVLTYPVLQSI